MTLSAYPSSSAPSHDITLPRFDLPSAPPSSELASFENRRVFAQAAALNTNPVSEQPTSVDVGDFTRWGIAFAVLWFIIVALHEIGGTAQSIGAGLSLLVLLAVLLTQGAQAMRNALALFQPST